MNASLLQLGVLALTLMGVTSAVTSAGAQTVTAEETTRSVRRLLERLPYYGGFDSSAGISFTSSSRTAERCCWVSSTAQPTDHSQNDVRAR